jgi:hypothetical protein
MQCLSPGIIWIVRYVFKKLNQQVTCYNTRFLRKVFKVKREIRSVSQILVLIGCFFGSMIAHAQDLPPLPFPTDAQIQKGHDFINKIDYVLKKISLSDEVAVMKAFGFEDLLAGEYPDHRWVVPKGKAGGRASRYELAGTGLSGLRLQPWIRNKDIRSISHLEGTIYSGEVCITLASALNKFGASTKGISAEPVISSHPVRAPQKMNDIGVLGFSNSSTEFADKASVYFVFDYQYCASRFGITYQSN